MSLPTPQAQLKSARAIADVANGILLAQVEIKASPERVFRALTTNEVTAWWGSAETYRTTRWTSDFRVGGSWLAEGIGQDGAPFSVGGEYLEIDPPRRLVQTWRAGWDGSFPTTLTYRLEPIEGGTRLTLRHEGFGERAESCTRHAVGWERVLGWLNGHLEATS